jgi:hypothetical protein
LLVLVVEGEIFVKERGEEGDGEAEADEVGIVG